MLETNYFCEYIAPTKIEGNQYMNQKALQILEYHKIIEKLVDKASSAPGKELCRNLQPVFEIFSSLQKTNPHGGNLIHFPGNVKSV